MPSLTSRPATETDVATPGLADLLPDRWREGGNRRSVVATDRTGRVLGHCRGIDNDYHPDSRTLVMEILDDDRRGSPSWADVADALVEAQVQISTLPLHLKPMEHELELVDLCARHDGVLVQLMPPWRYIVDTAMRTWAARHRATQDGLTAGAAGSSRSEEMLDLYVEHYTAQHASWSPAASPSQLRAENAPQFVPATAGAFDPGRSTVLTRAGRISAQALVWPAADDGGAEITLQSRPYEGPTAREDMEACLAMVIEHSIEGDVLLIDSHAGEVLETAMMRAVPGPAPHPTDTWTAIVALPVPSAPSPTPLPPGALPDEAAGLARRLLGHPPEAATEPDDGRYDE